MIFSNKKSFFVPFFAVFFGAMVIMGFAQAIVGTLRWYNPSEEEHEKLGTSQTYIAKKLPKNHTLFRYLFLSPIQQILVPISLLIMMIYRALSRPLLPIKPKKSLSESSK